MEECAGLKAQLRAFQEREAAHEAAAVAASARGCSPDSRRARLKEELRAEKRKKLAMAAVKLDGIALQYEGELKRDREVVMEAVKKNWMALQFASEELKRDRLFIMEAVKKNWPALRLFPRS